MIRQETEYGAITLESNVYRNIAGLAASNCFGVKGMAARSRTDGLIYLLRKESSSKAVAVTFHDDDTITIDLHIMVDHGVNIPVVSSSDHQRGILQRHKAPQERRSNAINVHIDSIMLDER